MLRIFYVKITEELVLLDVSRTEILETVQKTNPEKISTVWVDSGDPTHIYTKCKNSPCDVPSRMIVWTEISQEDYEKNLKGVNHA